MTDNEKTRASLLQIMKSTLAAAFGVQSDKNRQQDFSASNAVPYIIAGALFTVVFVAVLMAIVYLVLNGLQKTE